MDRNRIVHRFSIHQVELLNAMAIKEGFVDFRHYYNIKLHAIVERSNPSMMLGCNECSSKNINRYEIPYHIVAHLKTIASDNCTDMGRIASKLIIGPLLSNHFKDSGF